MRFHRLLPSKFSRTPDWFDTFVVSSPRMSDAMPPFSSPESSPPLIWVPTAFTGSSRGSACDGGMGPRSGLREYSGLVGPAARDRVGDRPPPASPPRGVSAAECGMRNAELAGFSRQVRQVVARAVRAHRRRPEDGKGLSGGGGIRTRVCLTRVTFDRAVRYDAAPAGTMPGRVFQASLRCSTLRCRTFLIPPWETSRRPC